MNDVLVKILEDVPRDVWVSLIGQLIPDDLDDSRLDPCGFSEERLDFELDGAILYITLEDESLESAPVYYVPNLRLDIRVVSDDPPWILERLDMRAIESGSMGLIELAHDEIRYGGDHVLDLAGDHEIMLGRLDLTKLVDANLVDANLRGAELEGADLTDTIMP